MLFMKDAEERGQGLIEYALVIALVAIIVIAIITLVGPQVGNMYSRIITAW